MNQDGSLTVATAALPSRRSDAGSVRLGGLDVSGLVLCGDMYGAPYDMLAAALGVRTDRLLHDSETPNLTPPSVLAPHT